MQHLFANSIAAEPTKQTAIGEVPEHWQAVVFGALVKVQGGYAFRSQNYVEYGIPIVRISNVKGSGLDWTTAVYWSSNSLSLEVQNFLLYPGDVLISMTGDVGVTSVVHDSDVPALLNQRVGRLSIRDERLNPRFLAYVVQTSQFKNSVRGSAFGAIQANVSAASIEAVNVPLPPLPEQRAIAHILRTLQDAIRARRRELELERERKAALMQHLFTKGTRGEPTKQTEIGEMPESWQSVRLGDLCSAGQGVIQTGPFGSQLHASDYKEVGIPIVNPTHLGFNTIDETHVPRISREDADRLSRHYLQVGDILLARKGDFSRYSYISETQAGWLCGTDCLLLRLHNLDVDNYFVSVSMSTATAQGYVRQNSVGSIMPNLNTKILERLPLALPPLDQQHEITDLVRACDAKRIALEHEALRLEELFHALLEELMTGRLSAVPLVETGMAAVTGAPA